MITIFWKAVYWMVSNPWRGATVALLISTSLLIVAGKIQGARLEALKNSNIIAVQAAQDNANEVLRIAQLLKLSEQQNAVWKDKSDKTLDELAKTRKALVDKQAKTRAKLDGALDKSDWGNQPIPADVSDVLADKR